MWSNSISQYRSYFCDLFGYLLFVWVYQFTNNPKLCTTQAVIFQLVLNRMVQSPKYVAFGSKRTLSVSFQNIICFLWVSTDCIRIPFPIGFQIMYCISWDISTCTAQCGLVSQICGCSLQKNTVRVLSGWKGIGSTRVSEYPVPGMYICIPSDTVVPGKLCFGGRTVYYDLLCNVLCFTKNDNKVLRRAGGTKRWPALYQNEGKVFDNLLYHTEIGKTILINSRINLYCRHPRGAYSTN